MAHIFEGCPATLVTSGNPFSVPSVIQIAGVQNAEHGFILNGYKLSGNIRTRKQYTLGPVVYYYVFGPELLTLELMGTAFNKICGTNTDGVYNFVTFLAINNIAAPTFPKLLVKIDVQGSIFNGALENFTLIADPRVPLVSDFTIRLVGAFVD